MMQVGSGFGVDIGILGAFAGRLVIGVTAEGGQVVGARVGEQ